MLKVRLLRNAFYVGNEKSMFVFMLCYAFLLFFIIFCLFLFILNQFFGVFCLKSETSFLFQFFLQILAWNMKKIIFDLSFFDPFFLIFLGFDNDFSRSLNFLLGLIENLDFKKKSAEKICSTNEDILIFTGGVFFLPGKIWRRRRKMFKRCSKDERCSTGKDKFAERGKVKVKVYWIIHWNVHQSIVVVVLESCSLVEDS